jgi:hypothetical protein
MIWCINGEEQCGDVPGRRVGRSFLFSREVIGMNTESRPYAERKYLVVVREPGLLEQVVDYGTWVVVPIVKIGWEAYEKIKQRGLPALIQVMAADVASLVFPPGHPEINTIYTAHPLTRLLTHLAIM